MRKWTDTKACTPGGPHCRWCADTGPVGEQNRAGRRKVYDDVPEPGKCPKGVPADWQPGAALVQLNVVRAPRQAPPKACPALSLDVIQHRRETCATCKRRVGPDCGKVAETRPHHANIEAGIRRRDVDCPLGYWDSPARE